MRVFVADDEPRVRHALRVLLDRQPGLEVVGEAASVPELRRRLERYKADLLVLDWTLVRDEPHNALDDFRWVCPGLRVLILGGSPEARRLALEAGADAFACKCDTPQNLLGAVDNCRRNRQSTRF